MKIKIFYMLIVNIVIIAITMVKVLYTIIISDRELKILRKNINTLKFAIENQLEVIEEEA